MYKRIVIKIGTKVLSCDDGRLAVTVLKNLTEQIAALKRRGIEVVVVTSGAVGLGRSLMKKKKKPEGIVEKQVYAAVGQVTLMDAYTKLFAKRGYLSAQVLVTKEDFRDKEHYLHMKNCFVSLLRDDIVPIVNENDVIAIRELIFTDNDELAGLVASQLNVDAVMILTSVDGVMAGDPNDADTRIIPEIDFDDVGSSRKFISFEKSEFGRGGMLTKFNIAKKLASHGIAVYIANGARKNVVLDIMDGKKIGTKFIPDKKVSSSKRRIAYSEGFTKGAVVVNKCAEDILLDHSRIASLLPVGVVSVAGKFEKGDIIEIKNKKGNILGFGLARYDSKKAYSNKGVKNARPIIHYDYMFIL